MQKRGRTAAGTQRWYCRSCVSSTVRERPDTKERHPLALLTRWLTGNRSLSEVANDHGVGRRTLIRWFAPLWGRIRQPPELNPTPNTLYILDGVYLSGRENAALICRTMTAQLSWMFAERETLASWLTFLKNLPVPDAAVVDGLQEWYPGARIVRREPWRLNRGQEPSSRQEWFSGSGCRSR